MKTTTESVELAAVRSRTSSADLGCLTSPTPTSSRTDLYATSYLACSAPHEHARSEGELATAPAFFCTHTRHRTTHKRPSWHVFLCPLLGAPLVQSESERAALLRLLFLWWCLSFFSFFSFFSFLLSFSRFRFSFFSLFSLFLRFFSFCSSISCLAKSFRLLMSRVRA